MAVGVAHADAHVAHRAQLHRQGAQKLLGRNALLHELHGLADHQLGEPHRGGDLDARRRARLEDGDAAGDERRDAVDQDEHDQELRPHRAAEPQGIERAGAP